MAASAYQTDGALFYPLTKMNFLVHVDQVEGTAAFSEVTGIEAAVEQGKNALVKINIPSSWANAVDDNHVNENEPEFIRK